MTRPGSNTEGETSAAETAGEAAQLSEREKVANALPFVLRAWWLRNFKDYEGLDWYTEMPVTGPLWSLYSDPLCDQGNIDYAHAEI